MWAVWAMWASGAEDHSWIFVIVLVTPIYFLGTIAHSNKSVDYAGLVLRTRERVPMAPENLGEFLHGPKAAKDPAR